MRSLFRVLLTSVVLIAGCGPAAPTATTPTIPPAPPTVPSALSAAKPASPAPSPAAAAASPSAGAVASPSAGAVASPSAAPPVNVALIASGAPTPGFVLQSSAFAAGGNLPSQYSCGGQSPPLSWSGAPAATKAFALVDQDPDAGGGGTAFTHWVVFNIPPSVTQLDAGVPAQDTLPNGALQGQNGRRVTAYQGACPPAGSPPHHYTFQLFALDGPLPLQAGASIVDLQRVMTGHIVGQTQLVALFGH